MNITLIPKHGVKARFLLDLDGKQIGEVRCRPDYAPKSWYAQCAIEVSVPWSHYPFAHLVSGWGDTPRAAVIEALRCGEVIAAGVLEQISSLNKCDVVEHDAQAMATASP